MRKLFLLSLLSLAVGLGSCKKDEPEPDLYESVQGRWQLVSYTISDYDPSMVQTSRRRGPVSYLTTMQVNANTIEGYHTWAEAFLVPLSYQRTGPAMRITFPADYTGPAGGRTITQLTADSLTLEWRVGGQAGQPTSVLEDHYARQ